MISVWITDRSVFVPKEVQEDITGLRILRILWTGISKSKSRVGEKPSKYDLADYVLGHFSKEEQVLMDEGYAHDTCS